MRRRAWLKWMAVAPLLGRLPVGLPGAGAASARTVTTTRTLRRVRLGTPGWPSAGEWERLNRQVGGRLMKLADPLAECRGDPFGTACDEFFRAIRNPYYILDHANLTQTSGWADAWTSRPSAYAVAATNTAEVVAAIDFAREHRLRLVVKGAGHSYQGTSNAPDSLLVWTRALDGIAMHDAFVPQGCAGKVASQPAVSLGAGQIWGRAYDAVTTKAGRYVQGGGCMTVGVAGLISSGGFGSFSKNFGTAAAALLEAEVVTADGEVRIVNACNAPDLFWALKGGGGGSFGVITRVTLRTRELPGSFGVVNLTVRSNSDSAYRRLIDRFLSHYRDHLFNPHWGETVHFHDGHALRVSMAFQGLSQAQAERAWSPFLEFVRKSPMDYAITQTPEVIALPARAMWNPEVLRKVPGAVITDTRPNAPAGNVVWAGDVGQSGQFIHGYGSAWLPQKLLRPERRADLAGALFAASKEWDLALHFNKGLAGASAAEIDAARDTAMNPQVLDAFALAITGSAQPAAFAGVRGHEPDPAAARRDARANARAISALYRVAPGAGSYVSESDYFLGDWQRAFWGDNYRRLLRVKKRYDPDGLFFVRHGVGSEAWEDDGFARRR
jgi:FAD/FMN-containing dehydrogenase